MPDPHADYVAPWKALRGLQRRFKVARETTDLDDWGRSPGNDDYGKRPPDGSTLWFYWHQNHKPCGCRIGTTWQHCTRCNDGEVVR